jgi:hypothetical protein
MSTDVSQDPVESQYFFKDIFVSSQSSYYPYEYVEKVAIVSRKI